MALIEGTDVVLRSSFLVLLNIVGLSLTVWLLGVVVYRLAFHPLKSYPGPIFSRTTGIPTLYHTWKGDFHYHLYELHHRYGDKVRYSPNKLSINNVKALSDIYGFNKNVTKPEEFYAAFRVNKHAINTFNDTSKESHRRKRRIMAKAFSQSALPGYERALSARVDELIVKFNGGRETTRSGSVRQVFNMAHELHCLMLDIMGALCFGDPFGFVAGKGDGLIAQIHARGFRIYMTGHEPLLKCLYLDRIIFPRMFRASVALPAYAKPILSRRVQKHQGMNGAKEDLSEKGYEDILAHLLDSRDEETNTGYCESELLGEAILLMVAGSDTSSTAISAALFYICHHPPVLRQLQKELSETFASAKDIEPRHAENCRYLRACQDEAMRLCPPSPTNIPRLVGPGGIRVVDQYISEGLYVGVPNFSLFRNQEYFERPHDFVPERWIAEPTMGRNEDSIKRAQAAFQPFSIGPRQCIARHLASREVSYCLAKIFYMFDVELVGESGKLLKKLPDMEDQITFEQFDVFTSVEKGPSARLTLKEGVKL